MDADQTNRLTVLIDELDQCREEDRDSWGQMFQAIAACMAALAVIFVIVSNLLDDSPSQTIQTALELAQGQGAVGLVGSNAGAQVVDAASQASRAATPDRFLIVMCEIITVSVMVAAFAFMSSLGITASMRYYHMRRLERQIRGILGDLGGFGWSELKSVYTSLNPKHLYTKPTALHYAGILVAIGGIVVSCMAFFLLFWDLDPALTAVLLFFVALPFVCFVVYTYVWSNAHAEEWYRAAPDIARRKRNPLRAVEGVRPNFKWLFRYLLYPRPQDFAKMGFIVIGAAFGAAYSGADLIAPATWPSVVPKLLVVLVIFDGLCYQARYQWNDILGVDEDSKNPESEKRSRLQAVCDDVRLAKRVSAAVIIYRLALAVALMVLNWNDFGWELAVGLAALIVSTLFYERAKRIKASREVIGLVGVGYPLRLIVGFVSFCDPFSWPGLAGWQTATGLLILITTYVFGISFVGMTWALEGADFCRQRERGCRLVASGKGRPSEYLDCYPKGHVALLAKELDVPFAAGSDSEDTVLLLERLLFCRAPVVSTWNVAMAITVFLLLAGLNVLLIRLGSSCQTPTLVSALLLVWFVQACIFPMKSAIGTAFGVVAVCLAGALVSTALAPISFSPEWISFALLVGTYFIYMLFYVSFRSLSYREMVIIPEKLLGGIVGIFTATWRVLSGEA
ncbi:hypothetical protein H7U34_06570 [Collinsella tanakaei]|nr:hypothetical protein [Collinsella tanakaei]